jgi:hypothetical protein
MASKNAQKARKRAPRTETRTKQLVKMIKHPGTDTDTLDVVKLFVPEERLEKMPAAVQSDFMKMGMAMVDAIRAGEYDLRRAMH